MPSQVTDPFMGFLDLFPTRGSQGTQMFATPNVQVMLKDQFQPPLLTFLSLLWHGSSFSTM